MFQGRDRNLFLVKERSLSKWANYHYFRNRDSALGICLRIGIWFKALRKHVNIWIPAASLHKAQLHTARRHHTWSFGLHPYFAIDWQWNMANYGSWLTRRVRGYTMKTPLTQKHSVTLEHNTHEWPKQEHKWWPRSCWSIQQSETHTMTHSLLHWLLPHWQLWPLKPIPYTQVSQSWLAYLCPSSWPPHDINDIHSESFWTLPIT